MSERGGIPLSVVISAADRSDHLELEAVVDEVAPVAGPVGRPRRQPDKLHADKGDGYSTCRKALRRRGIVARIARRGIESAKRLGRLRYVIERTLEWVSRFHRLARRYERKAAHFLGFAQLACSVMGNIEFQTMRLEDLELPAASVGAAVSRLGMLLFGDPVAGARELARVLAPGAAFSLALWTVPDDNPYMRLGLTALAHVVPHDYLPGIPPRFDPLGPAKTVEGWLTQAGMGTVHSELVHWRARFPDFDAWWGYNTSAGPLNSLFAGLDADGRRAVRAHMMQLLDDSRTPSGGYEIESRCRLVWGTR